MTRAPNRKRLQCPLGIQSLPHLPISQCHKAGFLTADCSKLVFSIDTSASDEASSTLVSIVGGGTLLIALIANSVNLKCPSWAPKKLFIQGQSWCSPSGHVDNLRIMMLSLSIFDRSGPLASFFGFPLYVAVKRCQGTNNVTACS